MNALSITTRNYFLTDHLSPASARRFKRLQENKDFLAQEINRRVVQDHLRRHDVITDEQYQHLLHMTYHHKANKYLLDLIAIQPTKYLTGLKEALVAAKQQELIDLLP